MALHKYTVQEALNTVLNSDGDALKVDLDNVNISAQSLSIDLDKDNDTVTTYPFAASSSVVTSDTAVKGSAGTVYSVIVTLTGGAANDKMEVKDGSGGAVKLSFVASAAAQSWEFNPSVGVACSSGIYVDITDTSGSGSWTVTTVYA